MADVKEIPLTDRQHAMIRNAIARRDAVVAEIQAMLNMVVAGAGVDEPIGQMNVPADRAVLQYRTPEKA